MTLHQLIAFFDPPGHGPDWLWLVMALLAVKAVTSYRRQHGRD